MSPTHSRAGGIMPRYVAPAPTTDFKTAVLALSPSMFLSLEDTSGTTASDLSGNGHVGAYVGSPTFSQAAVLPSGGGLRSTLFNNTANYCQITQAAWMNATNFSLVIAFKLTNVTSYHAIINRDGDSGHRGWNVYVTDGQLNLLDGVGDKFGTGAPFSVNTSYVVGVTYDGTTLKGYVNGSLNLSTAGTNGWTTNATSSGANNAANNALRIASSQAGSNSGSFFTPNGTFEYAAYWPGTVLTATNMSDLKTASGL